MKKVSKILDELKSFSEQLNLDFNRNWFSFTLISKEQQVLTTYLSNCPEPLYSKYGKNFKNRLDNLENFYYSEDFLKCVKKCSGQTLSKKKFNGYRNFVNTFRNKEIKDILLNYCDKIDESIGELEKIAVLTKTNTEKEKEILYHILRHEWIHVLINKNNIRPKDWKYNEGLCTYFEYFVKNELNILEKIEKQAKSNFKKEYYLKGMVFRDLLKDVPDQNKIKKIKEFLQQNLQL